MILVLLCYMISYVHLVPVKKISEIFDFLDNSLIFKEKKSHIMTPLLREILTDAMKVQIVDITTSTEELRLFIQVTQSIKYLRHHLCYNIMLTIKFFV